MKRTLLAAVLVAIMAGIAWGQANAQTDQNFQAKKDVVYATHDGVPLLGDLYQPSSGAAHPALLFIHSGNLTGGSKRGFEANWEPYLAQHGYVVFSIDYRLGKPKAPTWPQVLLDCKAAIQYLRGDAAALGIDPERVGVVGDSAGALLTDMLTVTQDWPAFANKYPDDAYASASTKVRVAVPVYGIPDPMVSRKYTSISREAPPYDLVFGGSPYDQPGNFFEGSAIEYIREASKTLGKAATPNLATTTPWFIAYGMIDSRVPPEGESIPFVKALKEAGANVTEVPVPNVGHFWLESSAITGQQGEPICTETGPQPFHFACKAATPNDYILPKLMEFFTRYLSSTLESSAH
jgi:acetyl esterase/lipase